KTKKQHNKAPSVIMHLLHFKFGPCYLINETTADQRVTSLPVFFCRICVITLAETHPILQNGRTIKMSEKSKRLWRPTCTGGEEYTTYSCIRLLEVNVVLLERPKLLLGKGYIAVILLKIESKMVTNGLLSREEYESVISKRTSSTQPEPC
uniref:Uncharacterized protein n=1 Tax=Oncorhynchus mykiss TaxID=8022 RepID=A0A8C7PQE1_ONCMY